MEANSTASPIYADGRIYFLNEEGETTVLALGAEFKKLASNSLDGRTLASMAVSGKAIYLRTEHHLYRIEESNGEISNHQGTKTPRFTK